MGVASVSPVTDAVATDTERLGQVSKGMSVIASMIDC